MRKPQPKPHPQPTSPYFTKFGMKVDFSIEARARLKEGKQ